MSKKARSLVFLGPSDGEKVLLCFKWGVLNYALECRLDGVQNHSRSRPYPCTRAFSDGVGWPSPLLHGREDFWVIIVFCCWVGILCVCFQVDIVLQGISPQPPPVCRIHLDDATAALVCQNAHHRPAYWRRQSDEANQCMGMIRRPWWSEASGRIWPGCRGNTPTLFPRRSPIQVLTRLNPA